MLVVLLVTANSFAATTSTTNLEKPKATINPEDVWFGHNVSQTTIVLPQGHCSAGFQVVACGVTDQMSVATSPFIWANYILPNVYARINPGGPNGSFAFQLAQIGDGVDRRSYGSYNMSTTYAWATYRWVNTSNSSFYSSFIAGYYWSDEIPFSLRRPQPQMTPWQFSFMNLGSVRIGGPFFLNGEFGLLGMNESIPHLHMGSSLAYRSGNFSFHVGLSFTSTFNALWSDKKTDYWQVAKRSASYQKYSQDLYPGTMDFSETPMKGADLNDDFGAHPELSFQLYF